MSADGLHQGQPLVIAGTDVDPKAFEGDLDGTPYFIGCSDSDPQILESEEFAQTIEDLAEGEDIDVVTAGDEVVTEITEGDETAGGSD